MAIVQVSEGQGLRGIGQATGQMVGGFLENSVVEVVLDPRMSIPLVWWQRAQDLGPAQTGGVQTPIVYGQACQEGWQGCKSGPGARDPQLEHKVRC